MKILNKKLSELVLAGRWDIDFHLPAEGIKQFPSPLLKRIDKIADVTRTTRDPSLRPEEVFQYIDIASVDVSTGSIATPQELTGAEAPSRARKVVRAYDVIVSTCRPTRGAIAVVPPALHNQIASTAFSVVRAKKGINPFYLHYALRLESTLEQLRKWSTGSSYPAILDEDVRKTLIPVPDPEIQDQIAQKIGDALRQRAAAISAANEQWGQTLKDITSAVSSGGNILGLDSSLPPLSCSIADVEAHLKELGVFGEASDEEESGSELFDLIDE